MAVLTLPNCPEDNNYMGFESLEVILKNKEHIVIPVHFCTRCQSYLTSYGVTKDPTEVAREFYRQNPSAGHVENVVSAKPLI